MRRLTFRVIVAVVTFTLGIATATWWSLKHCSRSGPAVSATGAGPDLTPAEASLAEWKRVSLNGKATFAVPPHLTPMMLDTSVPHRAFHREGMEVTMFLNGIGGSGPCITHADKKLRRYEISGIKVGDRDATVGFLESAVFDLGDTQPLKGMIMCVPSIGDGEHEFVVKARYQGEQDRQDILRIVNSVKFH